MGDAVIVKSTKEVTWWLVTRRAALSNGLIHLAWKKANSDLNACTLEQALTH